MKTLTNLRNTKKLLTMSTIVSLLVFQTALRASEASTKNEEVYEVEQNIEDWMVNLSSWAKNNDLNDSNKVLEKETEIEDWMMDPNNDIWDNTEEELKVEDWMCNIHDEKWNTEDTEEELEIEDWMTDSSNWLNSDELLHASAY